MPATPAPAGTAYTPVPPGHCPLARALDLIGDRWTLAILREAFYGVRRFDQMQHDTGMPRTVLSDRLSRLAEAGLMRKHPYREPGRRLRHEYRLTARGEALLTAFAALMEWGEQLLDEPRRPPVAFFDQVSGEPLHVRFVSDSGAVVGDASRVRARVLKELRLRG